MSIEVNVAVYVALIEYPSYPASPVSHVRHSDEREDTYEEFVMVCPNKAQAYAALKHKTGYSMEDYSFRQREDGDLYYRIPDQSGPDTKQTCIVRKVIL